MLVEASAKIEKNKALIAARYIKQLVNKKHPIKNILNTLFIICIANNNSKVKFISKKMIYPKGTNSHIKYIQITVIYKAIIKYKMSKLIINNAYFINNLIPSVIGVSKPNKNNPGPTRNWNKASILRSHRLNIPHKTINTTIKINIRIIKSKIINVFFIFSMFNCIS